MYSSAEIRRIVDRFVGNESPQTKCDVCHHGAQIVKQELEDRGLDPTLHISSITSNGLQNGHIFVTISGDKVSDIDSGIVVVDAYLEQFCTSVMSGKEKKISFGSAEEIPSIVVVGENSQWFSHYNIDK